jgi:hypothetical protein
MLAWSGAPPGFFGGGGWVQFSEEASQKSYLQIYTKQVNSLNYFYWIALPYLGHNNEILKYNFNFLC